MDPTPDARQACLIGGVLVSRPLQREIDARPLLEDQELVAWALELSEAPREELRTGHQAEDRRPGAAVGAVTGDVARERRRDECRTLIGPPVLSQNPPDARLVDVWVCDEVGAAPGVECYLAAVECQVVVALAGV